ncbi:hypothetical protein [Novispirillum itersonii]|uniref:hypothetical protein n=1 Tax=Novispirillum itersonii TaxID=189 RepID=UPI000377FF8F|nr:hypothetical protein [Novispirillum itersonii]
MSIQDLYDGQTVAPPLWLGSGAPRVGSAAGWAPDLIVLMALGMARRGEVTAQDLAAALETLDLPALPCADVVWHLVQGLVRSGGLRPAVPQQGDSGYVPGPLAERLLLRAMTAPLEGAGGVLRTVVRVRMAFLDLLSPADRIRALERMLLALEVAAEGVSSGFEDRWGGVWGNRWILQDLAAASDTIQQVRGLLDEARVNVQRRGVPDVASDTVSSPLFYAAE